MAVSLSITEGQIWKDPHTGSKFEVVETPGGFHHTPSEDDTVGVERVEDGEWYGFYRDRFTGMELVESA